MQSGKRYEDDNIQVSKSSIAFVHYLSSPCIFSYRFIITMHFLLLQKQTNMSDCGVFAIAFAMAIYNRQWPELLCFDGLMHHFPASHRQRYHETTRTEMVKVFCKCRLQEEGKMICCDRCLEWYHSTCEVNVPAISQCNCTSLMITVTTSFSVMIIKTITDSDYILQQPSVTASSVMINFRA